MPRNLEREIDALYQRELEQLDEVHRAYLASGGEMRMDAMGVALLALKHAMIDRKMTTRLAAEIDALLADDKDD